MTHDTKPRLVSRREVLSLAAGLGAVLRMVANQRIRFVGISARNASRTE